MKNQAVRKLSCATRLDARRKSVSFLLPGTLSNIHLTFILIDYKGGSYLVPVKLLCDVTACR